MQDWTDLYNQKEIARKANKMIDEVICEIHRKNLPMYKDLTIKELALLCRFPIHVGTNIFVERLLRIAFQKENKSQINYPKIIYRPRYFKDTDEALLTYYYDFSINYGLLNAIAAILNDQEYAVPGREDQLPKLQEVLLKTKSSAIKNLAKNMLRSFQNYYVSFRRPETVGEYSHWARKFLPLSNLFHFTFKDDEYQIDKNSRDQIKECCRKVLVESMVEPLPDFPQEKLVKLSDIYADFIDHILSTSIVEGLIERFKFYERLIKGWNVKQIHSFLGYYYNENFKVFAVLAKRKNALLIGHAHGASNPAFSYKHACNELTFLDYYFAWGNNDSSWMKGDQNLSGLKILNLGSAYLSSITKWKKKHIDLENLTILYPSGPLMDFMSDLEEIIPEKNYQHRLNVLKLLKELRGVYPKLKILYKPFPGTYTNDPIKEVFRKEFKERIVEVIEEKPLTLYYKVDIVLWDSISTGFAESIQSNVPTLAFHSRYEYEQASPLGKELDKKLMECGMVFYDLEAGLKSFNRIINDLPSFIEVRTESIRKFKEAIAYPVSKKEFRQKLNSVLSREEA
jgi:hypothetical protein